MRSRFGFFAAILSLTAITLAAFSDRMFALLDRGLSWLDATFSAAKDRFDALLIGLGRSDLATAGAPLDGTLLNSMRHEAGVSRRSAARNI